MRTTGPETFDRERGRGRDASWNRSDRLIPLVRTLSDLWFGRKHDDDDDDDGRTSTREEYRLVPTTRAIDEEERDDVRIGFFGNYDVDGSEPDSPLSIHVPSSSSSRMSTPTTTTTTTRAHFGSDPSDEKPSTLAVEHADTNAHPHAHAITNVGEGHPLEGHSLGPESTRQTSHVGTEKGGGYAGSMIGGEFSEENARRERRLLFKLDIIILPLAILLYLSAYLDRGNLGNARLQGLEATALDGSDTKYSLALTCFYITYIVFSIPGTLLSKAINPSTAIAIGALVWSIGATCQAAVSSPGGVYACRCIVGIGEAMFGQSMALYFSFWFRRQEIAKRISFFIGAGALAGAFGGLIAYGVASINKPKIDDWRILFLIEGVPSVILAIAVFLFLPSRPQVSKYLTEDERTLALTRLNADSLIDNHKGIDWHAVARAQTDWKTYTISVMYSCLNLTLSSVSGFLPTIIKDLGYTAARAQLFTVPPYAVAFVVMLSTNALSDRLQSRGIPIACVFAVGILGWSMLLAIPAAAATAGQLHARYFACFCVVTAGYTSIPLTMAWQSNNTGSQSQRATSLANLNVLGQCFGILATFLFPTVEGPQFVKGASLNVAFSALGLVIALGMTTYYRMENKRRNRVEGGPPPVGETINTQEEYDLAKGFRYTV